MSRIWNTVVFSEKRDFDFLNSRPSSEIFKLSAKKISVGSKRIHTYADPFLFIYDESIFLFAEVQKVRCPGYIHCWESKDLISWKDRGVVLKNSYHFSYPFVFNIDDKVYMIPESGRDQEVGLYILPNFPLDVTAKKLRVLLKGNFADTSFIIKDNIYYAFTTLEKELKIFITPDILYDPFTEHPRNPIKTNRVNYRNGGGIIRHQGKLYRIAQNDSKGYGSGISIYEITLLNIYEYAEELIIGNYTLPQNPAWQKDGRHHFNFVDFKNQKLIAMDGQCNDYLINKILSIL